MILAFKKFTKSFILILIILCTVKVNAQSSFLQNTIDKLESFKSFSYQSIDTRKDGVVDTSIQHSNMLFLKVPNDQKFGYLFRIETASKTEKFSRTDLYNGQDLTWITRDDSTVYTQKLPCYAFEASLVSSLKSLKAFLATKSSAKIVMGNDSTINGIANAHMIIIVSDTIINKEHLYQRRDFFLDKNMGLPSLVTIRSRSNYFGAGISDYYDQVRYFDYKFDQASNDIASFSAPKTFHSPLKELPRPTLLTPGTIAPNWTLYDSNGKQTSLAKMKGKVVLLDFYFIGCGGCMQSLKPMNAIYKKYKNKNVVIASITERDTQKKVLEFEKQYQIKYPSYVNAANTVKSYHVSLFPTFYFIDKEGKIGNVFYGYNDDFEKKTSSIIDDLLNK